MDIMDLVRSPIALQAILLPSTMRRFHAKYLVVLAGLLLAAWTSLSLSPYTLEPGSSSMSVEGGSTLHDWTCPIETVEGTFQMETADADRQPLDAIKRVQIQVPVDAIRCEKETMNEKLREALQMDKYPQVYFKLKNAQLSPLPDSGSSWVSVAATGELILAGERRQIDLPVKGQRLANGNVRFVGSHTIRLSDYGIDRPSAMLGTIKVSEEVTVNFDVTAAPAAK